MSRLEEMIKKGRIKKAEISEEMIQKEFSIAGRDLDSAQKSIEDGNYKWATVQAYYAIFHAIRALLYKAGYREESHAALKVALKEIYIMPGLLPEHVYQVLERGMDLREMADYKDSFSKNGAEILYTGVAESLKYVKEILSEVTSENVN